MSDDQPDPALPTSDHPTRKQLRDARRQAHAAQQHSAGKGGDKKGKKGKGGRRP